MLDLEHVQVTGANFLSDKIQGLEQHRRFGPLGLRQVHIARRQRQAILGAIGFRPDDLRWQRKLAAHITHHHQLLVILLAEHGHLRLHARKQFQHDGGDTGEEAGTELALERIAQVGRRVDAEFLGLRVQVLLGRREQHVHAFLFQFFHVGLEGARVLVEVFVGAELQAVDEDGRDHRIAMLARQSHQRQVALVQVAHGGNKGGAQLTAELVTQFFNGGDDFHG